MFKFALMLGLTFFGAVSSQASTIFNDGFDPYEGLGPYTTVNNGGTIGPWTVGGAGVDWIGSYWQAAGGTGSVDMSAMDAGALSTTLNTIAGQVYVLTFYLSGNPDGAPSQKQLQVQVADLNQVVSFDTTGHGLNSMGWTKESFMFTAQGNDVLQFTSLASTPYGPALDQVTVGSVPEPGTYAIALLGLAGIVIFRRRR